MLPTAPVQAKEKKKITWEDFTFEEHVQAHVGGVPKDCILQIKEIIEDKVFRVNVFNPKTEKFIKSEAIKVITTPEGYIFESWQVDDKIE